MMAALKRVVGGAMRTYEKVDGFPWEAVWFALAASQLLKFLPGMEGKGVEAVEETWKADAPLYVVMIRNPNQWSKFIPPGCFGDWC